MIDGETWNYEVSNTEKVRNVKTGRILKQSKDKDGYLRVQLYSKNGRNKVISVHKLVATMFIPNPHNLPTVNHINEIKTNNRVENLEWATHKEQVNHGTRTERQSATMMGKHGKRVMCIETQVIYETTRQAERETGINHGNICQCCKGNLKTAGGYHWKFMD